MRDHSKLRVFDLADEVAVLIYRITSKFPKEEMYALADQLRRAVVSIPANIAEGQARQHTKEFIQHLSIAKGSLAELETLLIVANKLGYLSLQELEHIENEITDIRMPLQGLINTLQRQKKH